MQTPFLFDAHCHLGLMADAESIASQLEAAGLGVFDCGVDPREYEAARERAQCHTGIVTGVGLHPWWIADVLCDEAEISLLCDIASRERFVGEVGLDFGRRGLPAGHQDEARAQQLAAFERLCETIATHPLSGRVLSIHAVNAAGTVLDILEQNGLLKATAQTTRVPPPSSSTGSAGPRTISPVHAMLAASFPSTNACSPPSGAASTPSKFEKTSCL